MTSTFEESVTSEAMTDLSRSEGGINRPFTVVKGKGPGLGIDPADLTHGGSSTPLEEIVEGLLFASDEPLSLSKLKSLIGFADQKMIQNTIDNLKQKYQEGNFAFQIVEIAGGFHFASKTQVAPWVHKLHKDRLSRKLSLSALETLSIIAYKGPISRLGISNIRGVNSDGVIKNLLERKIIAIVGTGASPGRPMLYGVTNEFYKIFGLKNKEELPSLKEFQELTGPNNLPLNTALALPATEKSLLTQNGHDDDLLTTEEIIEEG